jgi:hypothetical protein
VQASRCHPAALLLLPLLPLQALPLAQQQPALLLLLAAGSEAPAQALSCLAMLPLLLQE